MASALRPILLHGLNNLFNLFTIKEASQAQHMKYSKRHTEIMRILREDGTITVADLAIKLDVSQESIRRDVKPLTKRGDLIKVHGAVSLPHELAEAPFQRRMRTNESAKRLISRYIASTIKDGDTIMMDTGTTTSLLARALLDKRDLTVLTNSSDVAKMLVGQNNNTVYQAGGEMSGDNSATLGVYAIEFIKRFHVQHSIISSGGIHPELGIMNYNVDEAEFAREVLSRGVTSIVALDHSKFSRKGLVQICDYSEFDYLVVDSAPPNDIQKSLDDANVQVIIAEDELYEPKCDSS